MAELKGNLHSGKKVDEMMDRQIAKAPSNAFVLMGLGSLGLSLLLRMLGSKEGSQFIGQWVPTLMIIAVYNKMLKEENLEHSGSY